MEAKLPGFSQSEFESDEPVFAAPRACGVLDVVLRKNWHGTLSGRVTGADGAPGPAGISIDLIQVDGDAKNRIPELLAGFGVKTDARGQYSFRGVPPGRYKVVLNVYKPPTQEFPFAPLYWLNAQTEAAAAAVEVKENGPAAQADFRLLPPLRSALVTMLVLLPDGTPASEVHANIGTKLNGIFEPVWQGETDSSGRISFAAMEGFEYTLRDLLTQDTKMASEVRFSAADAGRTITIHLIAKDP